MDSITFTITLPHSAPLSEYVGALKAAQDAQARLGNIPAFQALAAIHALAERGWTAFSNGNHT